MVATTPQRHGVPVRGGPTDQDTRVTTDPAAIAAEAGLRYAEVDDLTIARRRQGRGFSYHGPRGGHIDGTDRDRIERLAIPPAWTEVAIAATDDLHLLAVGTDDAGRRQYLYHPGFRRVADEVKFARLGELGDRIPRVRDRVVETIRTGDERERLVGLVVRLIDLTLMRVGSERYAEDNESFGASTLRCGHASVGSANVTLTFEAKGGNECIRTVDDPDIVEFVAGRLDGGDADDALFATSGGWRADRAAVADHLSRWSGLEATAKDLRTWGASATMVDALVEPPTTDGDPLLVAFDAVAERLGNTRAVARDSYVAPAVPAAHETGALQRAWAGSRRSTRRTRQESTLSKVLSWS